MLQLPVVPDRSDPQALPRAGRGSPCRTRCAASLVTAMGIGIVSLREIAEAADVHPDLIRRYVGMRSGPAQLRRRSSRGSNRVPSPPPIRPGERPDHRPVLSTLGLAAPSIARPSRGASLGGDVIACSASSSEESSDRSPPARRPSSASASASTRSRSSVARSGYPADPAGKELRPVQISMTGEGLLGSVPAPLPPSHVRELALEKSRSLSTPR